MSRLFAAQPAAVFCHILIDIFVPDIGFGVTNPGFIERFIQPEIAHDCRDNRIFQQFSAFFHIFPVNIQNMIACNHLSEFIHAQTTVRVAVIGKAHVTVIFHDKTL